MRKKLWFFKRFIIIALTSLTNKVVIITGIPRSGSTLIYNTCRILLQQNQSRPLQSGWINDYRYKILFKNYVVLKIHHYDKLIAWLPCTFLHTTRNIFEVAASISVKENLPSIATIQQLLEDDQKWKNKAHITINYTSLDNKYDLLHRLCDALNIENRNTEDIIKQIHNIPPYHSMHSYDPVTLMHANHISGAGKNWERILPKSYVESLKKVLNA